MATTEEVLIQYHTLVRSRLTSKPGCNDLFFLTHQGAKYTQVYRKITQSINANNINVTVPPPSSTFRIEMSTKAAKELSDSKRRNVIKHYEFVNIHNAAKAHKDISKLLMKTK